MTSAKFQLENDRLVTSDLSLSARQAFPYYSRNKNSAYLDTAASALKIDACIERMHDYYSYEHANVHRGAYSLSMEATENFERARQQLKLFFRVPASHEVIFTAGATDSFNLVASGVYNSERSSLFRRGDCVLTTELEHHSNFVPWQQLARIAQGEFLVARVTPEAEIDIQHFLDLLQSKKPRIAAFSAHSNAFGTIPPAAQFVRACREQGCLSVVDITQSVVHGMVNIEELGADFCAFSAHKLYGPTGLGVLIANKELLEDLHPGRTGGGMISEVSVKNSSWAEVPAKFEAGTPPIAEVVSFAATLDRLTELFSGNNYQLAEQVLFDYSVDALSRVNGTTLLGPLKRDQASIISFTVDGVHPHDMATIADSHGVQVRAGHHCVMPAMRALQLTATTRMSLGLYSTSDDIDRLVEAVVHAQRLFS